ncbi:MAG: SAM-dependent chlorinase/fluorinase [Planctomycetes bacterium]|nr:SAM-dependent chlorinase/fluorinase [Planctomycetota bacterium]
MSLPRPCGIVALLTDYGSRDPYAGVLRATVLRAYPKAQVLDLGHEVPAHDVATGSLFLGAFAGRLPAGTVTVVVVDPGVGTDRRVLLVRSGDGYWLAPDNGVLEPVLGGDAEVRMLALDHLGLPPRSRTFHGRDVLAPVAGWLAGGRYGFTALGPRIDDPVRLPTLPPHTVVHVDHFGNLITNVGAAGLDGATHVRIAGQRLPIVGTYADVAIGALAAVVNSYELLEIAIREGSAAARLGVHRGAGISIESAPGARP